MMTNELDFYKSKLESDGCGKPGRVAMLTQDDTISAVGPADLTHLGEGLIKSLGLPALALYEPALPFYNDVIKKVQASNIIVPTDTETRTFLHDIPFVRQTELDDDPTTLLSDLLGKRKGVMVENLGIITTGPVTLEQAYINASSLFHAIFVKHLLDLHNNGFATDNEHVEFNKFRQNWLKPLISPDPPLHRGLLTCPGEIYNEMTRAGKETVNARLVDSAFGNISCKSGNIIYISQTGASLDNLTGCIDPVPLNSSTTCGITASSELLAHRLIYEQIGDGVILHGHPKFSIIMSMICDNADCSHEECWNNCPELRSCRDIPIVSGEIGAGGLAEKVSPVIKQSGRVIVFGHGVFTSGRDFNEAFDAMLQTEATCREEYFRRNRSNC
jgi:ribulose-5-phosphate 4-epimerase/fuculose-1-phosphate aldolase